MIIRLIGNVQYPLTLDPTVWIFDDRKILMEDAFNSKSVSPSDEEEEWEKTSKAWDREIYQQRIKPPVNKSISRMEGKQILKGTFVMPIKDFLTTSEPADQAKTAVLHRQDGEVTSISLEELENSLLLFAKDGKPIREDGPVHIFLGDGSNKDKPITGINKIEIK